MARIDTGWLIVKVVHNIQVADAVRRDPPVVKAAKQVRADGLELVKSSGDLIRETRGSWRRNS